MRETWLDATASDGVRLRVRTVDGPSPRAPALLLHHGLASSQRIWDLMLPRLAKRFRVLSYDARGHGLSGKPVARFGFDQVSADALAVMKATGLRRPILAGHSWGAMVALELAVRSPRSISKVVLIDGGIATREGRRPWPEFKAWLTPPDLAGTPLSEFRRQIPRWAPVPVTPEIESMILSIFRVDGHGRIHPRPSRANHFKILHAIWEQDTEALYERLRVRALAILARGSGDPDWERRRRGALRAIDQAGAPVDFTWITGVHDLPVQHPGKLCGHIERFADRAVP
jgi:pimeloyl-ACP methyl ester carboxylesterase